MRFSVLLIFSIVLISACTTAPTSTLVHVSTATITSIPADTVLPTATLSPTYIHTPRPEAVLNQRSTIYSGPGTLDYQNIAELPVGTTIYPLGIYGDFVKAITVIEGNEITGFLWKNALERLPEQIPVLQSDDIPWQPLYLPTCSAGEYNSHNNSLTFTNTGDGYYDSESNAIFVKTPLRIKIDELDVKHSTHGSVMILGIPAEFDESWWKGITRLDIMYNQGTYLLGIRDGSSENYTVSMNLPVKTSQPIQILFDEPEGKSFVVLDQDNKELRRVDLTKLSGVNLPNGLFPEGKVYIGTSTAPNSSLIITGLTVEILPEGNWTEEKDIGPGLVELANKHNLTMGTEFSLWRGNDYRYCQIMKRDFNVAALSEFSFKSLWLGPGEYDFAPIDRAVDYANQNGWRVRGSHLVWGAVDSNAIPEWLLNGNFTRDEYIEILEQHVRTIVKRYEGRVHEWSIANETSSLSLYRGGDFWLEKIGPEYIEMAFRWAREEDPDGTLIFNEFNNESPRDGDTRRIITRMYNTVKELKEEGVPIDVVGMQMHLLLKYSSPIPPKKEDVIQTMKKFADLGVRIYITEFDVTLTNWTGSQADSLTFQSQLYKDMVEACLESGVCDSFATWGISDSTSWITCSFPGCVDEPNAAPLMFDKDFNAKPAYFAVRDALAKVPSLILSP